MCSVVAGRAWKATYVMNGKGGDGLCPSPPLSVSKHALQPNSKNALQPNSKDFFLNTRELPAVCSWPGASAGMLSVPSVWAAPGVVGGRKALDAAKAKFAAAEGDLVTFLNVHRAWLQHGKSHRWWVQQRRGLGCIRLDAGAVGVCKRA